MSLVGTHDLFSAPLGATVVWTSADKSSSLTFEKRIVADGSVGQVKRWVRTDGVGAEYTSDFLLRTLKRMNGTFVLLKAGA